MMTVKKKIVISAAAVFLLVLLVPVGLSLLLHLPGVQNYAVHKAIEMANKRIKGRIALERIGIALPRSIDLGGLVVMDAANDTILAASGIRVRMDLFGLLRGKVHIRYARLSGCVAYIRRQEGEKKFNVEKLFALSGAPGRPAGKKKDGGKKTSLDVRVVRLRNTRFLFDDQEGGVQVEARTGRCAVSLNRFELENLRFGVNSVALDSPYCAVRLFKKGGPGKKKGAARLPHITVKTINVTNAGFFFEDTVGKIAIRVNADRVNAGKGDVDVDAETVSAGSVFVRGGRVGLDLTAAQKPPAAAGLPAQEGRGDHRWKISAGRVDLAESRFDFDIGNAPRRENSFDPAHMHFRGIAVLAVDAFYSVRTIRAKVFQAGARDSSGMALKKFAVNFSMDDKGISAQDLCITTSASDVRASCRTGFSPFAGKMGFEPGMPVIAALDPCVISTGEARYFLPALAKTPPFKGDDMKIKFSGKINGTLNSLKAERLWIACGSGTELRADGRVGGLPDAKKIMLDIPALKLRTGGNDVLSLLGKGVLPRDLIIPSQVSLDAAFKGSPRVFQSTVRIESDKGAASGKVSLDSTGRYTGMVSVSDLNPGLIYQKAGIIGRTTLSATFDGRGFDARKLAVEVNADAHLLHIKGYPYRNCRVIARIDGRRYLGTVSIQDENLTLDANGVVHAEQGREAVQCKLNLRKADFAKLHLLKDSMVLSGRLEADLRGKDLNTLSGRFTAADIALNKAGASCRLDSVQGSITTSPQNQTFSIHSSALDALYNGSLPAVQALRSLVGRMEGCIPVRQSASDTVPAQQELRDFLLTVNVYDHPLFSGILLPKLTACKGATMGVSYSEKDRKLRADAGLQYGKYNGMALSDIRVTADVKNGVMTYVCLAGRIGNGQAALGNIRVSGASNRDRATGAVSVVGRKRDTAFYAVLSARASDSGIEARIDPSRFILGGYPWSVSRGNYAVIRKNEYLVHDLVLSKNTSRISITSSGGPDGAALSIGIRDFSLGFFSQMLRKDSTFVNGICNADISVRGRGKRSVFDAGADIRDIMVRNVGIGSLTFKAQHQDPGQYRLAATLAGEGNDLAIQGTVATGGKKPLFDLQARINSLAARTVEPFTFGAVTGSRGYLTGSLACTGRLPRPLMNGKLVFRDVSVKPSVLNSAIRLGNETIDIVNSVFRFQNFSISDQQNHSARISGSVSLDSAGRFGFDLKAGADDFQLLNTTKRNNPVVYGRLIADWQAAIGGTQDLPVIDSRVVLKAPSSLTFTVPEAGSALDRGENIVVFSGNEPPPGDRKTGGDRREKTATFRGIDLTAEIEADRRVSLRIIPDPSTRDSLVVRGDAALNFGLDKSGKISLTGTYYLSEGSYTVTLPPIISKKFTIGPGSRIMWNGDPANPTASIEARYNASAAPIDLFDATRWDEDKKSSYRKPRRFDAVLNLNGPILKPAISFSLDLAPSDKGAISDVDAMISQINQDPTALNKQVFALLVLGKFVPESMLDQTGGESQLSAAARSSVSSFLAAQLSQWGASLLPGVQLNVGVQSWSDTSSGQAVEKTLVDLGVRKQLFNDRLSVEVGGTFDPQGQKNDQNAAKDISGNVAIEYKLTEDGTYSVKGFRRTQNESALEGQVTETGAGVVYSRSFNLWRQLFKRTTKEKKGKNE